MSDDDKATEVLRRLYPKDYIGDIYATCLGCGLLQSMHRKTLSGQVFHLGCDHAAWLSRALNAKDDE